MEQARERMKKLVKLLNEAAKVYYQGQDEIMSNFEYDKLYDELVALEKESGIVLAGSPTAKVGYEVISELPKERHETPSLSLDKTKEADSLVSWLSSKEGVMSWKMDGLTVVLTYNDGKLQKAVTRGNGEVGEIITANAKTFVNLPLSIPFKQELVVRGEALIKYSDFEKMNAAIPDEKERYKNPRNLCSGSVRQLNSEITAQRNVHFFAFALVKAQGISHTLRSEQFAFLASQGFEVVEYHIVHDTDVKERIGLFSEAITGNDFPSDGLVLSYNDIAYGISLGSTAKYPRDSIAFKWQDELAETVLSDVEWSASRTGLINPIAVFEPVELEGTTVSRASLHNISIMEQLQLGLGDTIKVYKANMIIPQIAENLTKSNHFPIPEYCPVCHEKTRIKQEQEVKVLYCPNPDCIAKKIKTYALFVSRDAMNIDGMSEATIEKFVNEGMLSCFADFYRLASYKEKIVTMEGFGEKSYQNLISSIEASRKVPLPRFLYSLGIAGIGLSNAKVLVKAAAKALSERYANDTAILKPVEFAKECLKWVMECDKEELTQIQGIGPVLAQALQDYFEKEANRNEIEELLKEISFVGIEAEQSTPQDMQQMTFVITGSVQHFKNRGELKNVIEERGGKVAGSVSSKTTYLINNDAASTSSKNKKAAELGIPILTEEAFMELFGLSE